MMGSKRIGIGVLGLGLGIGVTYWGHGLDLSGLRDVIGHVTIRLAMVLPIGGRLDPSL